MEFDYRKSLRDELQARKSRNDAYSLRAFARDLGISLTALHEVMNAKRHFSRKNLSRVSQSLGWTSEQFRLASAVSRQRSRTIERRQDWHLMAIMNLSKINCPADAVWIGQRLGLDPDTVINALDKLIQEQLIVVRDGQLFPKSFEAEIQAV